MSRAADERDCNQSLDRRLSRVTLSIALALRLREISRGPAGHPAQHWVADTTRIRQQLEYREPVAPDEAIRRTIEWMRANPPVSTTDSGTSKQPFDGTGVLTNKSIFKWNRCS